MNLMTAVCRIQLFFCQQFHQLLTKRWQHLLSDLIFPTVSWPLFVNDMIRCRGFPVFSVGIQIELLKHMRKNLQKIQL